jgi:hypothetical protein
MSPRKEITMFNKKFLAAVVLAGATLAPAASFAANPSSGPCILREHRITAVTPYRVQQHVGRGVTTRLAGAEVFIQAEPGLTPEWLQLKLTRHIAAMQGAGSMANCALDVKDVGIKVDSAGPGFAVKIFAKDPSKAEEVLRRARLLVG